VSSLPPQFVTFLLICLLIHLAPGRDNARLATSARSHGRAHAMQLMAGTVLGLALLGAVGALAITEIIALSRAAYEFLRWLGVLFLFYLAWEEWWGDAAETQAAAPGHAFRTALSASLRNPAAIVFFATVLPTFIIDNRPIASQAWWLVISYVAASAVVQLAIVLYPVPVTPGATRYARRILSLLLVVVVVRSVFTHGL
jgi:threonine/homoserine/homoserine lactone efflux protein